MRQPARILRAVIIDHRWRFAIPIQHPAQKALDQETVDQEHAEADFAHPDQIRMAETRFSVRAVEAAKQDESSADRTPISRKLGFGFEDCEAEAVEKGTPGSPADVFFGVAGDDAAGKDEDGRDDTGEGAMGGSF